MALDPYVKIRQKFEKIVSDVKKTAARQNEQYAQQLKEAHLAPDQLVLKLFNDRKSNRLKIDNNGKQEYFSLARHENLIWLLYNSRLVCNSKDDEKPIKEGLLLFEKEKYIHALLLKAKKQLPPFTYPDYLANEGNAVFYEMDEKPESTSIDDYLKIIAWQTNKKVSCIKLEFSKLRENFIKAVKDEIFIKDILQAEISLLKIILNRESSSNTAYLISSLQRLKGISSILMPEDLKEFHHTFDLFLQGENFHERLSPPYFEKTIKNIETGRISEMPVFGLSLFMYYRWLQHLSKSKKNVFDREESSFDDLFLTTLNEGDANKENTTNRLKKKWNGLSLKTKHLEAILLQELEKQRKIFNRLEYPHYFDLLEQKEKLKNCFINDCLRSFNIELPKEELRESIMLNENILCLNEKLCLLKHNPIVQPTYQLKEDALLLEVFCHMGLETEIINDLIDANELIKGQISNVRIPMSFITGNANCIFPGLFKNAIKNFKLSVENMNNDTKGCFITNLLRDLNYMETLYSIKCKKKNTFFKQLKELLKNELENAHDLQSFKPTDSKANNNNEGKTMDTLFNFGYHPGPRELKPIMDSLQLRINIFKDAADVDAFIKVFTCEDLTKVSRTFKLGCQTNQFKAMMEYLEDYSTNFNPSSIEKSGLFISKKGKPITANCLTASNTDSMKSKHAIKNIFLGNH